MQLCDLYESSKYGAVRCGEYIGGCQGATLTRPENIHNCYPYAVWSGSTAASSGYYYVYDYRDGSFYNPFGTPGHVSTFAVSVRCVLDLKQSANLQLCDHYASSSFGAAQCQSYIGGCQGSSSGSCWASHMWSCFQPGTSTAQVYILDNGSLVANGCDTGGICSILDSFTVRCVLDLTCNVFLWDFAKIGRSNAAVCSCATVGQVLLTVLRSVIRLVAAVRALFTIPTATRTTYGQVLRVAPSITLHT